ncbi:MAG: DUF4317 domain-containing protein [Clostridia bacterium]|nr:DUF4317 domain-containing protein [Clostridia bacterium]
MNRKDIAQIRRRLHPEHSGITCIRGCYVNGQGEVISSFSRPLINMPREEAEKYLALFKRTLSGTQGQNLIDIAFSPEEILRSPEHQLLTALKDTALKDDEIVEAFFQRVISCVTMEEHYLILLMHDGCDLPRRGKDEDEGPSEYSDGVFHYVLCSVCPVKLNKPCLSYDAGRNDFCSREADWVVCPPEMGFMFPAFEERAANIYQALYYTRDTADAHESFVDTVFHADPPLPAAVQKETFQQVLQYALQDECSYEVMQAVHDQVMEKMEEQKADKRAEPLKLSKYDVTDALAGCGVSAARMEAFHDSFDQAFGDQARLDAVNIVSPKQFELRTPAVVVKVNPGRSDLVETRLIDGHPYILIRADEGVEVNGVSVNI